MMLKRLLVTQECNPQAGEIHANVDIPDSQSDDERRP